MPTANTLSGNPVGGILRLAKAARIQTVANGFIVSLEGEKVGTNVAKTLEEAMELITKHFASQEQ